MNVLLNEKKNNSVSSTMFLKLTIKVVVFFLGHPVLVRDVSTFVVKYNVYIMCLSEYNVSPSDQVALKDLEGRDGRKCILTCVDL